jgi:hypothetical protein
MPLTGVHGILAVANRFESWFDPIQVVSDVSVTRPLLAQELTFAVRTTFIAIVVANALGNVFLVRCGLHNVSR